MKFLHWPGAAVCLVLGVGLLSLVFLPLLYTLKAREQQRNSDRIVAGTGTVAGILVSLGILFKVMQWPGANVMCAVALLITLFVFLPIYFFSGVRNPQTKVNTIVSSVLLFAGCALVLILVRAPGGTQKDYKQYTGYFFRNQRIVESEARLLAQSGGVDSLEGLAISRLCEELKAFLVQRETGLSDIDENFNRNQAGISETYANVHFADAPKQAKKLELLKSYIKDFNTAHASRTDFQPIVLTDEVLNPKDRVRNLLNDLTQIQIMVIQNQRLMLASR